MNSRKKGRYCLFTFNGTPIVHGDDVQGMADYAFSYMENDRRPHIGYLFDSYSPAMPFTVFEIVESPMRALVGHPLQSFVQVAEWWQKRKTQCA
jgi:hypothetical protein